MTGLGLADLVLVAARVLGVSPGQAIRLIDLDAAAAALSRARGAGSPEGAAAALLVGLVRAPVTPRDAAQVALASALQWLALDGQDLELDPPEEFAALLRLAADGTVAEGQLAGWLSERLRSRDAPTAGGPPATDLLGDVQLTLLELLAEAMSSRQIAHRLGISERTVNARIGDLYRALGVNNRADAVRLLKRPERSRFGAKQRPGAGRRRGEPLVERFTDQARAVVELATDEARHLGHAAVGTQHVLLGLLRQREGVAIRALASTGVSYPAVRDLVEEVVGRPATAPAGYPLFSPRSGKVFALALREALRLGQTAVGPEHLLLGLLGEGEGVAALVLVKLGLDLAGIRARVLQLLWERPVGPSGDGPRAWSELQLTEDWLWDEVERLRRLLRRHGIDPDSEPGGEAAGA